MFFAIDDLSDDKSSLPHLLPSTVKFASHEKDGRRDSARISSCSVQQQPSDLYALVDDTNEVPTLELLAVRVQPDRWRGTIRRLDPSGSPLRPAIAVTCNRTPL